MSTDDSKLVEIWHMYWLLLRVSAQLEQHWLPSFREQSDEAADEALSIAQKLTGFEREFESLGELREYLLEQIVETGATLADRLSCESGSRDTESRRRVAEDSLFIARTLGRCVDLRTGRLTVHHDAQLALWSSLSSTLEALEPPRRGPELVRHSCTHVLERLEDWIKADLALTRRDATPSQPVSFSIRGELNEPA